LVKKYADVSYFYISGYTLLRDPHHNKGLAFTEKERDAHHLRGLLPPAVVSQELQVWSTILARTVSVVIADLSFFFFLY
jgi:malate dehydrogenase (oxaloacetate-decarboxylating)(NADP+)